MKEITINDIAKKANVSISTVSRVISGYEHVKKSTKDRVEKVIKEYNFELNFIAQGLSRKKTLTIGVIVLDINNLFFSDIVKGINEVAMKNNYDVLLANTNFQEDIEIHYIKAFIRRNIDGILITPVSGYGSESMKLLIRKKIPFFVMNYSISNSEINYITTDNYAGAYIATNYLIKLGHTKIGFIMGLGFQGIISRMEGYKKALLENGIKFSEKLVIKGSKGINREDGYILTKKLLSSEEKITAIFTGNDMMAIGAMQAIFDSGKKVPEDISLIGYDNLNICNDLRVPLTTINQPKYEQGKLAVTNLINLINNKGKEGIGYSSHLIIKPELIIRDSCKKLTV